MSGSPWKTLLKYDPTPPILNCGYENLVYFTKRDLLNDKVGPIKDLWQMKEAERIVGKQQKDGSWKYPNPKTDVRGTDEYNLLETYQQLGFLVEKFGFNKSHSTIKNAKEFIFAHQSKEGDIRGIYWNQYSPNYTAGMLELLIKAGYKNDPGVKKGLKWLLSIRQDDGGWVVPIRTTNLTLTDWMSAKHTIQPDRTKPFSYMVTGIVLRAFAYHPRYQQHEAIHQAAELVLSRMFLKDTYSDRGTPEFWTKFTFPFWFTDLIAVLDPIAYLGFKPDHPKIKEGLGWFVKNQAKDGTWKLKMLKGEKIIQPYWFDLAISRLFKMYYT